MCFAPPGYKRGFSEGRFFWEGCLVVVADDPDLDPVRGLAGHAICRSRSDLRLIRGGGSVCGEGKTQPSAVIVISL